MKYSRYTDLIKVGTATASSPDTTYPASNLMDLNPALPAKLTTQNGTFVRDMLANTRVDGILIVRPNFDTALEVYVEMNATNSWGSPSFSHTLIVPAPHPDLQPYNLYVDVAALVPIVGDRSNKRYVRINIVGTNSAPISIGELVLISEVRSDIQVLYNSTRNLERPAIIHETELGVRRVYDMGTTIRGYVADVMTTKTNIDAIDTWFRSARGAALPFTITPDPVATSETLFASFRHPTRPYVRKAPDGYSATLEFIELSKGLYP